MANNYVELSNNGGANYYRFELMYSDDPTEDVPDVPSEVSATLDGTSVISFGAHRRSWAFDARVIRNDSRSGYATLSIAKGFFSATTIAANQLKFRDRTGTTYDVVLVNKGSPRMRCLSTNHYADDAVWVIEFKLRQI